MLALRDNPPLLTPGVSSLAELKGRWWIAHTKARAEKVFAWDLLSRGIGFFLPLIERVKYSGGRKRHLLAPLFSSYVFFCGSDEDRYQALRTDRLCQVIPVSDQDGLLEELTGLEKALAGKAELDPYPFAAVGRRCRIKAGPFMGLEGIVVERKQIARLVLVVSILGQGASLEIDADLLEPID